MIKEILKKAIFNSVGSLIYLFFPLIIKIRRKSIFVLNYHTTYPDHNKNFVKQILFYKKYFDLVDENYFLKNKNKNKNKQLYQKPKLMISFDDGHISNFYILNILKKYKVPATFFIPYEFVNRKREKNLYQENKITNKKFNIISNLYKDINNKYKSLSMSFKELKKLTDQKYIIGAHGYSHIRLSENLSNKDLSKEIIKSKKMLEKKLKIKINSFCWTFGDKKSYSTKASQIIRKSYKLSFMTCGKPFDFRQNLFQIHRFNIENFFSLFQVAFVLSGIYELIYYKKRNYVNRITK